MKFDCIFLLIISGLFAFTVFCRCITVKVVYFKIFAGSPLALTPESSIETLLPRTNPARGFMEK
jgi:hypothetical protein